MCLCEEEMKCAHVCERKCVCVSVCVCEREREREIRMKKVAEEASTSGEKFYSKKEKGD